MSFIIRWVDARREPECAPDPAFPDGKDVSLSSGAVVRQCKVPLPYPSRRCGAYDVRCDRCGMRAMVSTAGRADDPRSITMPCKDQNNQKENAGR